MGNIPILGKATDLREKAINSPDDVVEWINHPSNHGLKLFLLDILHSLRSKGEKESLIPEDVVLAYLSGFMTGMTLVQGVFLGPDAFIMAREAVKSLVDAEAEREEAEEKAKAEQESV